MNMHFIVLSLAGAVLVGVVMLVWRVLRYRKKKIRHDEVVQRAVSQMRQTGIFLSLGLNPRPSDITKLQEELKRNWGYTGEIDGHLNGEVLDAIDRMATARGVDVEAEASRLFAPSRSDGVLPAELRKDIVLQKAEDRLNTARKLTGHGGHKIA